MAVKILIRRDTTSNWQNLNPVLGDGELGIERIAGGGVQVKIGDGVTEWKSLPWFTGDLSGLYDNGEIDALIEDAKAAVKKDVIEIMEKDIGTHDTGNDAHENRFGPIAEAVSGLEDRIAELEENGTGGGSGMGFPDWTTQTTLLSNVATAGTMTVDKQCWINVLMNTHSQPGESKFRVNGSAMLMGLIDEKQQSGFFPLNAGDTFAYELVTGHTVSVWQFDAFPASGGGGTGNGVIDVDWASYNTEADVTSATAGTDTELHSYTIDKPGCYCLILNDASGTQEGNSTVKVNGAILLNLTTVSKLQHFLFLNTGDTVDVNLYAGIRFQMQYFPYTVSGVAGGVASDGTVTSIKAMAQPDYDALVTAGTVDSGTLYIITGAASRSFAVAKKNVKETAKNSKAVN